MKDYFKRKINELKYIEYIHIFYEHQDGKWFIVFVDINGSILRSFAVVYETTLQEIVDAIKELKLEDKVSEKIWL